jgi:uncharacterized protein (TIGR00297 family)
VTRVAIAVALAAALAAVGRWLRWLTTGGAVAAAVIGASVFWGAGAAGALLLGVFFVSGSLLTATRDREPRTARQVLANGACAAAGALLIPLTPLPGWLVLAGAIAAAQADTWATEIGARASAPPRLVTTFSAVPAGTSGAVTLLGTAGGVLGAGVAAGVTNLTGEAHAAASAVFAGGVVGMLVDSLAGATVQAKYRCPACGIMGERPRDACGVQTVREQGVWWADNDVVNLLATFVGACGALGWHFLT